MLLERGYRVLQRTAYEHMLARKRGGTVEEGEEGEMVRIQTMSTDHDCFASAQRELPKLQSLEHPNLLVVHETFFTGPLLYHVTSPVVSDSLSQVVSQLKAAQHSAPEVAVIFWSRQIFAALQHMESKGIAHPSLKTSGVHLCACRRHVRLGEFVFEGSPASLLAYMAPEVVKNEQQGTNVHVWAAGCVLHELCTLQLPFQGVNMLQVAWRIVHDEPACSLICRHSEELRSAIQQMLQKDGTTRPSSQQVLALEVFAELASGMPMEDAWIFERDFGA